MTGSTKARISVLKSNRATTALLLKEQMIVQSIHFFENYTKYLYFTGFDLIKFTICRQVQKLLHPFRHAFCGKALLLDTAANPKDTCSDFLYLSCKFLILSRQ
jgi:hypothetical protein